MRHNFIFLNLIKGSCIILMLVLANISFIFAYETTNLSIHFIDAGEGDAVLIKTPKGKTVLIDTGNLITGHRVLSYLKKNNINFLDHLILTHYDLDHIGGAFFILQTLSIKNVYDNGQDLTGFFNVNDIYRWYVDLVRKDKNYQRLKAEDILRLDSDITLKTIWPFQPVYTNFNINSLVIILDYNDFRCLLTGDAVQESEYKILEYGLDLNSDVLKLGHHGAEDASSDEFIKAVSPKIAIISVNARNIRNYPSNKVISRLEKTGIKIYRTDINGDIILNIYPNNKGDEHIIRVNTAK